MDGSHEIARTVRTRSHGQFGRPRCSNVTHTHETEIYPEKISDCQRPLDNTVSNDNIVSGNAEEDACSIKHCKTAADTGGGSYGHIGDSSFSARCSLASSVTAESWEINTGSEENYVQVTDRDVREIL